MIGHYLASALGKFRKSPFTTAANILTLALGLACFIAAYGIATYWRSGDSHHPGAERLAHVTIAGNLAAPVRLGADLRREQPDLEAVARLLSRATSTPVASDTGKAFLDVIVAEPEIFDVFSYRFLEGAPASALRAPGDVVLVEDAAARLFGGEPALGRTLLIDGGREVHVSGVIARVDEPSFQMRPPYRFDMLENLEGNFAAAGRTQAAAEEWGFVAALTIVRLPATLSLEQFQQRLDAFAERAAPRRDDGELAMRFTTMPLSEITATSLNFFGQGAPMGLILLGLGTLILVVACVNYANLAAAQAAGRLKETGMRRVLGAGRGQLLGQSVLEAALLTLPALGLSVAIIGLAAPVFRNMLQVDPTYFLTAGPEGPAFLAAVSVISAAAAAAWPALTLARVRTSDAIGAARTRPGAGAVSRVLVGVQFFSASFLIIVVAVTQIQHAHTRSVAFDPGDDPVLFLNDLSATGVDMNTLQAELRAVPQVRSMSATRFAPWTNQGSTTFVGPSAESTGGGAMINIAPTGPAYFETASLRPVAGRMFDPARDRAADPGSPGPVGVVIDEALAESLGFTSPEAAVGQTIYRAPPPGVPATGPQPAFAEIVGVVEAVHFRLNGNFGGVAYTFSPDYAGTQLPVLRIDGDDVPGALAEITRIWDSLAPDIPLRAEFADELFERQYAPYHVIAGVFVVLSASALAISTVGILAIAVHVVARRRHEIGVRKTLGATTARVLRMLIADFSKPVVIGNLLAWPFAWMAAQTYLQPFAERAPMTLAPFVASLIFTLLVAWLAVGGQAWKAARVKPALVLKAE